MGIVHLPEERQFLPNHRADLGDGHLAGSVLHDTDMAIPVIQGISLAALEAVFIPDDHKVLPFTVT